MSNIVRRSELELQLMYAQSKGMANRTLSNMECVDIIVMPDGRMMGRTWKGSKFAQYYITYEEFRQGFMNLPVKNPTMEEILYYMGEAKSRFGK